MRKQPRNDVVRAARRERIDHRERMGGPVGGMGRRNEADENGSKQRKAMMRHGSSLYFIFVL
jgi:hypothetical protein